MIGFRNGLLSAMIVLLLLVVSGPGLTEQNSSTSGQFTNEAGNPIMAGDLDRVSQRTTGTDSPAWTEGHRWEPRRDDPHPLRQIMKQQRLRSKSESTVPPFRYFLLLILTGALLVRGLLGWIVYRDIQTGNHSMSVMWIPVVLLAGTPGAIAYGVFRLSAPGAVE